MNPKSLPQGMPPTLVAGDSLELRYSAAEFPASAGWSAVLRLVGPQQVNVEATADQDAFLFEITSTASAEFAAGTYTWVLQLTSEDDERHTVAIGNIAILPDPASLEGATDQRSFAAQRLADLETHIASKSTHLSFSVFGRAYQFESWSQLLDARERLKREVAREQEAIDRANGRASRSVIKVRF